MVVVTVLERPGNVTVPVGLRAALLAGFPVLTVAVTVVLFPKMTLLGFATAVVVVA